MLTIRLEINRKTIWRIEAVNKGVPKGMSDTGRQPRQYLTATFENDSNGYTEMYDVRHDRADGVFVLVKKIMDTILEDPR